MTKKIFAIATTALLLVGCTPSENATTEDVENIEELTEISETIDNLSGTTPLEEVVGELSEPEENDGTVIGSCNAIETHSTCIDYVGSFWAWEIIQLGCSAEEGMFASRDACPNGSVGGCQLNGGTANEMITWFYDFGGEPIDGENVQFSAMACNATLGASWIGAN